jgi:hypothetical protein
MNPSHRTSWIFGSLLAGLLAIRVYGISTDFWLDEIWVLNSLEQLNGFGEIFTRFRFPNNHLLNTCWMYAVYPQDGWIPYRLLSLLTGCGLLVLIGWQKDTRIRHAELLFIGGSYAMIILASEARGYAPLVFFAYAAWRCLPDPSHPKGKRILLFALCCVLGTLAQATFIFFLGGATLSVLAKALQAEDRRAALAQALRILFIPLGSFAAVYLLFYRHLHAVIPKEIPYLDCLFTTVAHLFGQDDGSSSLRWILLGIFLLCNGWILRHAWQRNRPQAIFYLATVWLLPLAVLVLKDPRYFAPRNFILPMLFFLVFLARLLVDTWEQRKTRPFHVALLLIYFTGQLTSMLFFVRHGRGGYAAVAEAVAKGNFRGTTYASNADFINNMVLDYHLERLDASGKFTYAPAGRADTYFYIDTHLPCEDFLPEPPPGSAYRALPVKTCKSAPFASFTVLIYSRLPPLEPGPLSRD